MRQGKMAVVLILTLAAAVGVGTYAQSSQASTIRISVDSSQGRSYQQAARGSWSTIYAGREVVTDRPIATTKDAALDLQVGSVKLRLLALSIASISELGGTTERPSLRVALRAGALELQQPPTAGTETIVHCSFGEITGVGADFRLDGNRLRVERGSARVVNSSGSQRTVRAGEELLITPDGFLAQPQRFR